DRARQRVVVTPTTPVETPVARDARRHEDPAEAATPVAAVKPSAAAPETPEWQESPESPPDDAVVRVRFERVAAQLPAAAFTLPMDRVAESLREPHWLTVPRRRVLPPPPAPVAAPPRDPVAESLRSAPAAPTITPPPAPAIVTSAPPLPIPPTRVAARAPAPPREVAPEVISRDALTRLAACLAGAGT